MKNEETIRAEDLSLYMYPTCLYCRRVMSTLEALDVAIEYRNIHADPTHRDELVAARGRATVPVLRISSERGPEHDEWMPESADIMRYLAERFSDGTVPRRTLKSYLTEPLLWVVILGVIFALVEVFELV